MVSGGAVLLGVTEPLAPVVPHGTVDAEFVDLLVADDEWVDREFEALVAAGWGVVPPVGPAPGSAPRWPRRPGSRRYDTPLRPPRGLGLGSTAPAHQRGPPTGTAPLRGD
jgi:hypothetical protein